MAACQLQGTRETPTEGMAMGSPDNPRPPSLPDRASRPPEAPALRAWVRSVWTYTSEPADFHYEQVMPSTGGQLLLNLFGPELRHWDEPGRPARRIGPVGLQGALTRPVVIDSDQKRAVCGVSFRSGGATAFHDIDAMRFTDTILDGAEVWGADARKLHAALCALDDPALRLGTLEAFLTERIRERPAEDRLVRTVADALASGRPVAEVQEEAGLSRRGLHELLARRVGLRPKLLARVERFSTALDEAPRRGSWVDLAATTGFSDQAHLSREFVAFSGSPPTRFRPIDQEPRHALGAAGETFKRKGDR
ncbi:MAG: helix-turn-helix domain-containing protein [Myxococcota bacterium]|nr:helix-turn-helix domain-containing protein [Myxococcota bacterium]